MGHCTVVTTTGMCLAASPLQGATGFVLWMENSALTSSPELSLGSCYNTIMAEPDIVHVCYVCGTICVQV